MKVYAGLSEREAEATYELGEHGLLRWTDVKGAFHINATKDGGIRVYVPSNIKPKDVDLGAVIVFPICPTCHQAVKEVS